MLLLFRQGAGIQADVLHTVIIQQIAGIECLPPGVIGLTADIRIFAAFKLLADCLLGPLIDFTLIRGYLLPVPYCSYVILILYGNAVNNVVDGRTNQFDRDTIKEDVAERVTYDCLLLRLNDVQPDTRLLQQFEWTCELTLARFPLTVFHLIAMNVIGHIRTFTNH